MKKLRIGFSKPKNVWFPIFSWAIRLYEKTPYSHVYIRWETKWGTWLCYHAASLMIHFLGEASFARHITIVKEFEFEVSDEKFDKLMSFCTKYVGEDYALRDVLLIPLNDLGVKYSAEGANKQYCAELVMRALGEMDGKQLTQDADRVKLKYVYDFVKEKYENGAKI
jgi:hypothetical protein